ncbi:hypothetical protein KC19_VG195000 [Ceratodon purpureus]|uniref:Uncharacterized protein n=1 Tax=Ceratodon purpureus TaxID=3225 RepID=A0A8T0HS88_CERPU|nr:hypothetical protein KC19_VG195000 [Ceratodon purpureus]
MGAGRPDMGAGRPGREGCCGYRRGQVWKRPVWQEGVDKKGGVMTTYNEEVVYMGVRRREAMEDWRWQLACKCEEQREEDGGAEWGRWEEDEYRAEENGKESEQTRASTVAVQETLGSRRGVTHSSGAKEALQ